MIDLAHRILGRRTVVSPMPSPLNVTRSIPSMSGPVQREGALQNVPLSSSTMGQQISDGGSNSTEQPSSASRVSSCFLTQISRSPSTCPQLIQRPNSRSLASRRLTLHQITSAPSFSTLFEKPEAKYPKSYLDLLDKQYVLSVPAVWSDKAKDATLRVGILDIA